MIKAIYGIVLLFLSLNAFGQFGHLSDLHVEDRGELQIDLPGEVYYKTWQFQPLMAPAKTGMIMLMPARLSSRKDIAALEEAIASRKYDYRLLSSTTIVNMDDSTWGAGLFIQGELKNSKIETPLVHLIIDEKGELPTKLGLSRGQVHVLLHDCRGNVHLQHSGPVSKAQARNIVENIDRALAGSACNVAP